MTEHNHVTRDIKRFGSCPGCDVIHFQHIDGMSITAMLAMWRLAPIGTFQVGDPWTEYFEQSMAKKREADPEAWVRASKDIGW